MWRPRLLILQPTPYCNINCQYCYLGNRNDRRLMSPAVIDAICDKIFSRIAPDAAPTVVWHAGEPTVAPLTWYEHAYRKLRAVAPRATTFSIQSNGVAMSDDWLDFLRETDTRVGLSIDGPQRFHDARRKTRKGGGTWVLAMKTLRRLQAAGFNPGVISVLHPDFLPMADEFYEFYRSNDITEVSFSIDEAEGANSASSFDGHDHKSAMVGFLVRLLSRAFADEYPLHVREIERISHVLSGDADQENEQLEAWQTVVVAANGDVTSFSPEFMELASTRHNNFCFGNILQSDFAGLVESELVKLTQAEIRQGVEICRASCRYFAVCRGGAPANKMTENKSLASGETSFCRLSIQAAADALIQFLSDDTVARAAADRVSPAPCPPPPSMEIRSERAMQWGA
jgi:uncharacterized protein